jgi:hypothetical protein
MSGGARRMDRAFGRLELTLRPGENFRCIFLRIIENYGTNQEQDALLEGGREFE